jgi:hypothetical protein
MEDGESLFENSGFQIIFLNWGGAGGVMTAEYFQTEYESFLSLLT